MKMASEQQAREVAQYFDVWNDEDYTIFTYIHRPTKVTLFGIKLFSGSIITTDPRAAAPRNIQE
jgi:hypothetical protein